MKTHWKSVKAELLSGTLIRGNTVNPEWYVQYIIEQRQKAGLPELEGVDEARPTKEGG